MGGSSTKPKRVLMLGLDNSGKSSLLRRLDGNASISHMMPTQVTCASGKPSLIFCTFQGHEVKALETDTMKLNVWDIGGQTTLRPYWKDYFANAEVLVRFTCSSLGF